MDSQPVALAKDREEERFRRYSKQVQSVVAPYWHTTITEGFEGFGLNYLCGNTIFRGCETRELGYRPLLLGGV